MLFIILHAKELPAVMTQVVAHHNQSSTNPFTTACFACAAFAASLLLIHTLNTIVLGVLIISLAVLLIGLISLFIRLVALPPNRDTERA